MTNALSVSEGPAECTAMPGKGFSLIAGLVAAGPLALFLLAALLPLAALA